MRHSLAIAALLATLFATSQLAAAEDITRVYSSTADKNCRKLSSLKVDGADYASDWSCKAPAGLLILKNEDDLRETVSAGRSAKAAAAEPAASQGFGPFNSTTTTIEWRISTGRPFAMIQRWHIADNDDPDKGGRPKTKQMLVVTRLPPGTVCHVAYIDVTANPESNSIARKAADELARGFDCKNDGVNIVGAPGRATSLAMPVR